MQQQKLAFMLPYEIHKNDRITGNLLVPHCPHCKGPRSVARTHVTHDDPIVIRYLRCKQCQTSQPHESDIRDLVVLKPVWTCL
jgi:formate dehydrogenase maturation protein FdhE